MSEPLLKEPYLTEHEYLEMERISPFKHEYSDGVMYAMHCESEHDYFEMETQSPFRHEYVEGVMYAMAGAKMAHHKLERDLTAMLCNALRNRRCDSSTSNLKLRVPSPTGGKATYYYPDAMIWCDPLDEGETDGHAWIERPSVIFEIISSSTRDVDEGRKRKAYLGGAALVAYVRIEQDRREVNLERRAGVGWVREQVTGVDGVIRLPEVEVELPLEELYRGVKVPA